MFSKYLSRNDLKNDYVNTYTALNRYNQESFISLNGEQVEALQPCHANVGVGVLL